MKFTITIDGAYAYCPKASSINTAVKRALDMHDAKARERKSQGFQSPRTIAEMARKRGVRVYITAEREVSAKRLDTVSG